MTNPYTVNSDKLEEITNAYNEYEPTATPDMVEAYITSDSWTEGDEHQEWIDDASPEEIADWIANGVFDDMD